MICMRWMQYRGFEPIQASGEFPMLTTTRPAADLLPVRHDLLSAETHFYLDYDWSLDPHLTVGDAIERLAGEIDRLPNSRAGWQTIEVTINMYLLSCSLLNGIEEYLRGHTLRLPAQLAQTRPARLAMRVTDRIAEGLPKRNWKQVNRWKQEWQSSLDAFLAVLARCESHPVSFAEPAQKLSRILEMPLPSDLLGLRLGVPSAFSRLGLTHLDVLALGRQFMGQYPERSHPVLFLGLRTAGTYFSALLGSFFKAEGYRRVGSLTMQPKKGPSRREHDALRRYADQDFTLAIVDDPPSTGDTIVLAIDIARQAGFDLARIKALVPTHPATRNWSNPLPEGMVITLEPERWQKQQLLHPRNAESRLAEYFVPQGCTDVRVVGSRSAEEFDGRLPGASNSTRDAALEQIYEVQLRTPRGKKETRHVLAKSVGLGYLGYSAFLTAHRLSGVVAPVIGLRDGILYTEWLPQRRDAVDLRSNRDSWIDTAAAYVAARTRFLGLPKCRVPGKAVHENGLALLAQSFGRAYGRFVLDVPMRSWIQQRLYRLHCPCPTLIDGNMGCTEWIESKFGLLKTGYYRHGLGKTELNAIDPAYDLAEAILCFALSLEEEDRLIRRYVENSGDAEIRQRLFINKLLAGLWTMKSVQEQIFGVMQTGQRQQELHRRFLGAWDFLTTQTARFCGARCHSSGPPRWRAPLFMLDIDGVLDRRVFGFPCTTAAGIEALSLLAEHGCSVALNTARSVKEVKDYCEAYRLAGGVAENGAYLWDAVGQCGRSLLDQETIAQLDELRRNLQQIPGVFLDERHQYSIRAYMFEKPPCSFLLGLLNSIRSFGVGQGVPIPLPTLLVSDLITTLRLDRLSVHRTVIDTAIVAKCTDKGSGLMALREQVLGPDAETIAIGDSEADLPMFRAATRSFAPAQIPCRQQARLLGCRVSPHRYQRGLLDSVRSFVGRRLGDVQLGTAGGSDSEVLFLELLQAADYSCAPVLVRALFDRTALRIFVR